MHSIQPIQRNASIDFKCPGKLITLLPGSTRKKTESQGSVPQTQQEQHTWKNGKERDLPTAEGKTVLITTNFKKEDCPCQRSKRKFKIIEDYEKPSFVSTPHCELVPKGSDWWIRDLQSVRGTFVNGTKLSENGEKKLEDLDIISLGVSHRDSEIQSLFERKPKNNNDKWHDVGGDMKYCNEAPHIVYLYKAPIRSNIVPKEEKSSNLVKLELESHLLKSVIENELIMFNILSSLSVSELKNARLVCKKWRDESTKWFYSFTRVDVPGLDCPHWSYLKDNYDSYFNGKKIENVSLDFDQKSPLFKHYFQSSLHRIQWMKKGQLYLENVDWFFNSFGQGIKSLKLNFKIDGDNWSLFLRILERLPTVKDLQLSFISKLTHDVMLEKVKFPEEMQKLPSVKSLSIQIKDEGFTMIAEVAEELRNFRGKFEPLLVGLMRIFPSVEKLTFPYSKDKGTMEIFINIIKDNAIPIPKVKDLAITFHKNEDFDVDKTVEIITAMPFVNKLRSLELYNLKDYARTNLIQVISLLRKTAPYLESLALGCKESNSFITSLLMEERGRLLEFPRLWRLKLLTMNSRRRLLERDYYQGVNYETVFPNLKSLEIVGMLSNRLTNCHLEHFLRMDNGPCRTIVEFELFITSTIETEPVELRQSVMEKFPNVDFPKIQFSFIDNYFDEVEESEVTDENSYSESDYSEEENDDALDHDEDDDEEDDEEDNDHEDNYHTEVVEEEVDDYGDYIDADLDHIHEDWDLNNYDGEYDPNYDQF